MMLALAHVGRPFSSRLCLSLTARTFSCWAGKSHCSAEQDSKKGVLLCQQSKWKAMSGTRGLRLKPEQMIRPMYKEDGVDPEQYLFLYTNRMQKMRLKGYSKGAVFMTSVCIVMSVPIIAKEITEFQWSDFGLFHPLIFYSGASLFCCAILCALLKALRVSTHLKSIYKHHEREEYLAVKQTNLFTKRTEKFTFTPDDCVNHDNNMFVVGNIYIKNTLYHLVDRDFVVPHAYNTLMGYGKTEKSLQQETLNRRRRKKLGEF